MVPGHTEVLRAGATTRFPCRQFPPVAVLPPGQPFSLALLFHPAVNMIEIIREFIVKEAARGRFELLYGPGGAWSQVFARSPGFRGITLLRDTVNRRRYLMVEVWDSESQREQRLAEQPAEYAALSAALTDCSESRTELGAFTMPAQAAVRPARRGR